MTKRLFLILAFLIFCVSVFAQITHPQYKVYTLRDGLPQMQIWSMFQDSRGYLWIGTKGGISRYDGEKFTNYTQVDGILDNQIDGFCEDYSGNIWITTRFGLSVFNGSNFTSYPIRNNNLQLAATPDGKIWYIGQVNLPKRETLFGYFENGSFTSLINEYPELKELGYQIAYAANEDALVLCSEKKVFELKNKVLKTLYSTDRYKQLKTNDASVSIYEWGNDYNFRIYDYFDNGVELVADIINGQYYGSLRPKKQYSIVLNNNQVFWIKPDTIINTVLSDKWINLSFIDKDQKLWIGTDEGLYKILPSGFETYKSDALPMIWSMVEDKQKNLWFASFNFGLRKLKENSILKFQAENLKKFGRMFYFQAQMDERGVIYFPNYEGIMCYDGNSFSKIDDEFCWASYYDADLKVLIGGYLKHIKAFDLNHKKIREVGYAEGLDIERYIMAFEKDKKGNIWMGGNTGLACYNWDTGKIRNYNRKNGKLPCQGVFCIHQPSAGDIWFGGTQGLLHYQEQTDSVYRVVSPEITDVVNLVSSIDSTWLIFSQPTGIYLMDLKKFKKENKIELHFFNEQNGFLGLEPGQNGAVKDSKGNIWMTTGTEVVKMIPDKLDLTRSKIDIRISGMNGTPLFYQQKEIVLPRNERTVVIQFETICYNRPKAARYSYRINQEGQDWSAWQDENYAVLTALEDGKSEVQVRTMIPGLPGSEAMESMPLVVSLALWKQDWFFPSLLGFVSILVILSMILFVKTRTRLLEASKQAKTFQLQAILSQLNPHFIFNVMAAIQSEIMSSNTQRANEYLVKMSGLIRGFLEASVSAGFSKSKNIKDSELQLQKEIEILNQFVEFQQFVFPDRFDYELIVAPDIDTQKVSIPPMLIQPFVENSIKHGLLQKEGKGKLRVRLSQGESNELVVEIEDDGIGVERAEILKNKSQLLYTSRGKELTLKRIKLLNEMGYFIQFRIDSNDNGTKITLKIKRDGD